MNSTILKLLDEHIHTMTQVKDLIPQIEAAAQSMLHALQKGGKIFWMGNGGSAADSQHLAAELIGRFKLERRAIPSIALTTDSSILTCLSNDYDYSIVFARQLEALCQPNDVVIGLTTSGNSKNILEGVKVAKQKGAYTIGLSGHQGGLLASAVDLCITVPSSSTARIQEGHIFIGHTMCELVEHAFADTSVTAESMLA
jgi:D-sedoheptulose 7-phosphate isomerase